MRSQVKFEAVAIATVDTNGRYIGKTIVPASNHEQALAIATALSGIEQVQATPVVRDFDVFGRCYWTNRVSHD